MHKSERAVVDLSRDIESLRGRMGESTRQVEGLFESLLAQSFDGGRQKNYGLSSTVCFAGFATETTDDEDHEYKPHCVTIFDNLANSK